MTNSSGVYNYIHHLIDFFFFLFKTTHKYTQNNTWRSTVDEEGIEAAGWNSWDEARGIAAVRKGWRKSVEALRATRHARDG